MKRIIVESQPTRLAAAIRRYVAAATVGASIASHTAFFAQRGGGKEAA